MASIRHLLDQPILESERSQLTFSGSAQMLSNSGYVRLKPNNAGEYPITGSHFVTMAAKSPSALKSLLVFEGIFTNAKIDGVYKTDVKFKINNGLSDYWWNGVAWAVAGANDWGSHASIAANIDTFPLTSSRTVRAIAQLSTTDKSVTPKFYGVKYLFLTKDDYDMEDDVFRSLLVGMKSMRIIGRITLKAATTTSTLDLDSDTYKSKEGYDISSVIAAYNQTIDPLHQSSVYVSFDAITKILTLSGPITAGQILYVEFKYAPVVAVDTHTDFVESSDRTPSVALRNIRSFSSSRQGFGGSIIDFSQDPPLATVIGAPNRVSYRLDVMVRTPYLYDHFRAASEVLNYFTNNPILNLSVSEAVSVVASTEYEKYDAKAASDLQQSRLVVEVVNVPVPVGTYQEIPTVERFNISGANWGVQISPA